MGSSASKGARSAGASARKYPSRVPQTTNRASALPAQPLEPGSRPSVRSTPKTSETRTAAINLDARDPVLASRLNTLGAVQPNPHYSATSTSSFDPQRNDSSTFSSDMMAAPPRSAYPDPRNNPALRILEARQRIQDEAERELENVGRRGFEGRKYVDAGMLQLALMRKKRGESDAKIEEAFGIKRGRLGALGRGIVDTAQ